MPWWAFVLIAVAVATVALGIAFRRQLRFAMRMTKALITDQRLPRPLRWSIGVALAVKTVPLPDFGVDEVILVVVGALLLTIYRGTFMSIVAEQRAAEMGEIRS